MKTKMLILCLLCAALPYVRTSAQQVTLEKIWTSDTTLRVPESVYFHAKQNILFVTNIDGEPWAKDGKGFISRMTPDGKIVTLKWVDGLNSPKGMGVHDNTLYVADMDELILVDISKGAIIKREKLEGAHSLNDVSVDPQGTVYISDSEKGRIYTYRNGTITRLLENLSRPNGVLYRPDGLLVVDSEGLKRLGKDKNVTHLAKIAKSPDGIEHVKGDEFVVSCWQGEMFYVDAKAGTAVKLLDTQAQKVQTADIRYDPKKRIVYVPTFFGNTVTAYQLKVAK